MGKGRRAVIVYIASPYGKRVGASPKKLRRNVKIAEDAGMLVLAMGHSPIIPVMFHYVSERRPDINEDTWWQFCASYVLQSAVVWRLPGDSIGADREVELAREHNIPVVFSFQELRDFLAFKAQPVYSYIQYNAHEHATGHFFTGISLGNLLKNETSARAPTDLVNPQTG